MFRHLLVREIGVWLAIKLAALTAIFLLFFGPEQPLDLAAGRGDADDARAIAERSAVVSDVVRANISPVRISFDP